MIRTPMNNDQGIAANGRVRRRERRRPSTRWHAAAKESNRTTSHGSDALTVAPRGSGDLLDVDPRNGSSNDQLLDLTRTFKNGEDL